MLPNRKTPHKWAHYLMAAAIFSIGIWAYPKSTGASLVIFCLSFCFIPIWREGKKTGKAAEYRFDLEGLGKDEAAHILSAIATGQVISVRGISQKNLKQRCQDIIVQDWSRSFKPHNEISYCTRVVEVESTSVSDKKWPVKNSGKNFGDQLRERSVWEANRDIIKGYQLAVTLDFDTPYEFIMAAAIIYDKPEDTFDVPARYGVWVPYLGETTEKGMRASHFGQIGEQFAEDILMPFLAKYRRIVESDAVSAEKFRLLNDLGCQNDFWRKHFSIGRFDRVDSLGELWAFRNLTSLKGIGVIKARKLIDCGIYSTEQIE